MLQHQPHWVGGTGSPHAASGLDLTPLPRGVVRVDIELRDVAIDQCASGPGWFADTHRCDLNSTQVSPAGTQHAAPHPCGSPTPQRPRPPGRAVPRSGLSFILSRPIHLLRSAARGAAAQPRGLLCKSSFPTASGSG